VEATEELRINLTHALAHSVADAAALLEQLSEPAAAAAAAECAEELWAGEPRSLAFHSHAVYNLTPLPITITQTVRRL